MKIKLILLVALLTMTGANINAQSDPEIDHALMLQLVNQHRTKGCKCGSVKYKRTKPLIWSETLELAARDHSLDMHANNFFRHTGSDRSTLSIRLKRRAYNYKTAGENIGWNYHDEERAIEAWIKSPGHCKNIMNPEFTEIGISRVGDYWTMVLGARK